MSVRFVPRLCKVQNISALPAAIIPTPDHRTHAGSATADQAIRAGFTRYMPRLTKNTRALGPNVALREHFVEFHRTMRADLAKLVRRGHRDGSIRRGLRPEDEAMLVVAGLRGIAYQWRLDAEQFDPVNALRCLAYAIE